jgi:hypothetical protein
MCGRRSISADCPAALGQGCCRDAQIADEAAVLFVARRSVECAQNPAC